MKLLKPLPPFHAGEAPGQVPSARITALALLGATAGLAIAELAIGKLDAADSAAAIAEGGGRLATGGLIHLVAATLLGLAVAGLAPVIRGSVAGRIGWVLLWASVPCYGAFAMFHLILVETGAAGLDQAAMDQFLMRFQDTGVWSVPVTYFVFAGLLARLLVLIALVRRGVSSWVAPVVYAIGLAVDFVFGANDGLESSGHWVMAVGTAVAAYGLWQAGRETATQQRLPEPAGSGIAA
ncbi:hypothetical protein [Micromonospora avicenniae]|uniref:hypothetical protein n=1 Tax=Micromonospora avicenniae TaxID=1198245 RepID=UPI00332F3B37